MGGKTHWRESNDLEMMFFGTYRSEFYRAVRDLLHDEIGEAQSPDLQQRWATLISSEATYRQVTEVSV
jgi:anaerobic magnesium-protoporphyrin IX monomethyl ester cyclase